MKQFLSPPLPDRFLENREQRRLAQMRAKGRSPGLQVRANFNGSSNRGERNRLTLGQGEIGSAVVQLLGSMRLEAVLELILKAVGSSCPLISEGRKNGRYGMIRMCGDCTFGAEGD